MFTTHIRHSFTFTRRVLTLMLALLATATLVGCPGDSDKKGGDGGGSSASSKSPTSLSGTYESKLPDGTMTIVFLDGERFTMSMSDNGGGDPDVAEGRYTINGNVATLQVPDGIPMQLTIKGNMLEGSLMGQIMIFTRK